jgi:molybdenum cofactor synthesis domain-containing protein
MPHTDRTAGLIVVGNEILSGKVIDSNAPFLARELRTIGVELRRIVTIPDEVEEIAAAVREFRERFDVVFTSGGVGPTHDDVTIAGVARGVGRAVVRHPEIDRRLREFFKDKANEARLKMAKVVFPVAMTVVRRTVPPFSVVRVSVSRISDRGSSAGPTGRPSARESMP